MFNLKEILISPSVISIAAGWEIYCLYICSPHSANGCLYYSTVLMGCKENHPDVMTVYHRMATQTSHYLNCASVCVSVCACIVCAITVKVKGMEWFFKSTVQFMLPTVYLITFFFRRRENIPQRILLFVSQFDVVLDSIDLQTPHNIANNT